MQFMQLRNRAEKKFRTSTRFEPMISQYQCDVLTNWAMCSYVPVKEMNVVDVYEMNMLLPWMPLCPKSELPVCWLAPNRPVLLLAVFPNKLPPVIKHKEIQSWIVEEKFHTDHSWLQGLNNPTDFLTCQVNNGNRTEQSPIQSAIIQVINKIARQHGRSPICLILSKITDRIGWHKVLLPINHNYNKICDFLGFFKSKHKKFQEFFASSEKKRHVLSNYLGMMYTVLLHRPISAEISTINSQNFQYNKFSINSQNSQNWLAINYW